MSLLTSPQTSSVLLSVEEQRNHENGSSHSFPAHARKINPESDLREIVEQIVFKDLADKEKEKLLKTIVMDEGVFGKSCRIELYRGCYITQRQELSKANPDNISPKLVEHLKITDALLTQSGIQDMHIAERNGWIRIMNQHLCLLSLASEWGELHTENLKHTLAILNKVMCPYTQECEISPERREELIISLGRFLDNPPKIFFTDSFQPAYADALLEMIDVAALLSAPELRNSLKDLYWTINGICAELCPDSYGQMEEDEQEEADWLDDEKQESGGTSTLDYEDEDSSGYEIMHDYEPDFDAQKDKLDLVALEAWENIAGRLLAALRYIPSEDSFDTFFLDVLNHDSYLMPYWATALEGLACSHELLIKEFLPSIADKAVEDPVAVIHLLIMYETQAYIDGPCHNDTAALTVEAIKALPRKEQKAILANGKYLIDEECELIEDMDSFKSNLINLAKDLQLKVKIKEP